MEFKVGLITKVWVHPDADKLYCEEIDCGEEGGPRQIASGLRMHYSEEEMLGKRVLVVANLKVRVVVIFFTAPLSNRTTYMDSSKSNSIVWPNFEKDVHAFVLITFFSYITGEKSSRFQITWDGAMCCSSK